MKKEIISAIILFGLLLLIGSIMFMGDKSAFSSSWTRNYVNGKEIIYKTPANFQDCSTLSQLATMGQELEKELSKEKLTKVQYLDTIFRAFCIDYNSVEVSSDFTGNERRVQKIIAKAIELEVIKNNAENTFKPNSRISKIEALAFLFRLSGLELKQEPSGYDFRDVDDNWKHDVAAKATHLSLVYTSTSKNRFYPNTIMDQGHAYSILKKIARYYR